MSESFELLFPQLQFRQPSKPKNQHTDLGCISYRINTLAMVNSGNAKDDQSKEIFSVSCTKVEDAIEWILMLGMVVEQVRLNLHNAYYIVPNHPQGQQLGGS